MKNLYAIQSKTSYEKALIRLEKSISSGQFTKYTQQKKQQIWNRICRYARQLGIKIKASLATACIAAGLSFATTASAQTFVQQTATNDPFDIIITDYRCAPTFVDIDGDGDQDVFSGGNATTILYYKNTGTALSPVFTEQTGSNNPLNSLSFSYFNKPFFADIDGDGDKDLFVGDNHGTIFYFKNTGTALSAVFTAQTGTNNPFDGADFGFSSAPAFVDIDGDGDLDAFIGNDAGTISYYKNTGTALSPVFTLQTGTNNYFDGVTMPTGYSTPSFADTDADGDMDAFIGANNGKIYYYINTGTASAPVFTLDNANNPLGTVDVGGNSVPSFGDLDGDGDMDLIIGEYDATIYYFKNQPSALPLRMLSFNASGQRGYNKINWQTSGELTTKSFEIESSSDGRSFIKVATVNATGNGNNNYHINDNSFYSGKVFYRLKMIDADGRFTYSSIIWISVKAALSIYPNPATNVININIGSAGILNTNAEIFDPNGSLTNTFLIKTNQQQINVSSLSNGMHLIKFSDGTMLRFIKK